MLVGISALLARCTTAEQTTDWSLALQPPSTVIRSTADLDPMMWRPALTSTGLIVAVLEGEAGPSVGIFDTTGTLLHRFGRAGSGPGEFRSPQTLGVGSGDSLWVLVRRPSDRWTPPTPRAGGAPVAAVPANIRTMKLNDDEWETELNLFDLRCEEQPATLMLPGTVKGFVSPGVLWSYAIVADSIPELSIARVDVSRDGAGVCDPQ